MATGMERWEGLVYYGNREDGEVGGACLPGSGGKGWRSRRGGGCPLRGGRGWRAWGRGAPGGAVRHRGTPETLPTDTDGGSHRSKHTKGKAAAETLHPDRDRGRK